MTKKYDRILTAGTFDILHPGHLNIFKKAKEIGNHLIVAVSTDELVKSYKGVEPILPYKARKKLIEELRCVDQVVKQEKIFDVEQFKKLDADVFVVGDDWKDRKDVEGLDWLKKNNKIVFFPYTKGLSSSKIKREIIKYSYEIIKSMLDRK